MREVHIYAETAVKAFESRERTAGYVLEVVLPTGKPATKTEFYRTIGTYNEVILEAFAKALERMKEKCELHLHTHNSYILGTIDGPNLALWEKTGFCNAKGERIKCADLWESVSRGIQGHLVATQTGTHSYYNWMMAEMERIAAEGKGSGDAGTEEPPAYKGTFRVWDQRNIDVMAIEMAKISINTSAEPVNQE